MMSRNDRKKEKDAFEVGKEIKEKLYFDKKQLETIIKWKSPRVVGRKEFKGLNNNEVIKKSKKFFDELNKGEINAIKNLTNGNNKISGIGVPVASAILHFIFPKKYTIIDFRVVKPPTLKFICKIIGKGITEKKLNSNKVKDYIEYNNLVKKFANKIRMNLHFADKVLWQYAKESESSDKEVKEIQNYINNIYEEQKEI